MARSGEVKAHAIRLFAAGETMHALRFYDAIVRAAPLDYEARLKVADCLMALGHPDLAAEVYREVGWYCIRAGHPLVAVVAARVLEAFGHEADDLFATLIVRYGSESEFLGKLAARVALPSPDTPVDPPDLRTPVPDDAVISIAGHATHCLADFEQYPEAVHPIPLLSELSEDAFRRVVRTFLVRRLPDRSLVIREGAPGDSFFFVATGAVRVYATDGLGRQTELAILHEGSVFGEMALLSAEPRSASVAVVGEADLIEATRESLGALADELAPVAAALHRFTRERLLKNLLATSPLFRPFSRVHQLDLLRRFTSHDVAPYTDIIQEGDDAAGLFVLLSGEVEVWKQGRDGRIPLATLRAGAVFGEMAILRGGATSATVTASKNSTVLFLAREYVARIVSAVPEIARYLDALAEERELDTMLLLSDDQIVEDDERVLI